MAIRSCGAGVQSWCLVNSFGGADVVVEDCDSPHVYVCVLERRFAATAAIAVTAHEARRVARALMRFADRADKRKGKR